MLTDPISPSDRQLAQLIGVIAVAVLVGTRFAPARYRHRIGVMLTICYCAAVGAFAVYWLVR